MKKKMVRFYPTSLNVPPHKRTCDCVQERNVIAFTPRDYKDLDDTGFSNSEITEEKEDFDKEPFYSEMQPDIWYFYDVALHECGQSTHLIEDLLERKYHSMDPQEREHYVWEYEHDFNMEDEEGHKTDDEFIS